MKTRNFAAVLAVAGTLVAGAAAPAAAADGPVITSTGLTEGKLYGKTTAIEPIVSDDVVDVRVLADGQYDKVSSSWAGGKLKVTFAAAWGNDAEVDVTVRALDADGNTADATTHVLLDAVAPELTLDPPRNAPTVHGWTRITVTPKVDDLAEVVMGYPDETELVKVTSAPWVIDYDFTALTRRITFWATDRAGNRSLSYYTNWIADNDSPRISSTNSPYVMPGKQSLAVDVEDRSALSRIEWWIEGALRGTQAGQSGTFRFEYDFGTTIRAVPVEVRAWDSWGLASSEKFSVQIDGTKPRLGVITPARNALVRGTSVTTTLTATDAGGLGAYYTNAGNSTAGGVTSHKYVMVQPTRGDGPLNISWQVYDQAGNWSSYGYGVIVDNSRPKITKVTAPGAGTKVGAQVKTSMTATDKNGIREVQMWVNGKLTLSDSKAPYNLALNTARYGKSLTVAFYAVDRAGNVISTSSRTWKH
ncbi:Ig-like domain-containing protein [Actinoplanes sp. NBRC 103695]|uniref:Ig-like domain-containing protein n=1 Tax=Actinoplanes sp. NBRC 103695 TaxID=3032202 RepID=UPI0024A392ED|nr:Ig-like domain-containing protein [Actinoplanes sp. NBRC 103695]GLZ00258.1 hypothetical protein Acsp02_75100 [Actinoplanes sp. NBRC 103695]